MRTACGLLVSVLLLSTIPAWAQEGGREAMLERLRDPAERKRIARDFVTEPPYLANIGWHHVRLGVTDPEVNGKLVEEVSEIREMSPEEVFMDVVLKAEGRGIVMRVPLEGGGRLVVELTPDEAKELGEAIGGVVG